MSRGGQTRWKAVRVFAPGGGHGERERELGAAERLAALYRFQSGDAAADQRFVVGVEASREAPLTDPAEVDWSGFPVLAALEAVTHDELRRLRRLLRSDWIALNPVPPGPPSRPATVPDEPARWGFEPAHDAVSRPQARTRSTDV